MNNINTRLDQSNIFYELDNLVLFGEHPETEMDFLTSKGKLVNFHEKLMNSWTPYAEEDSFLSKSLEKSTPPSHEELLDFVSFDSTPLKAKSLDEETFPSKDLKDKVTESPAAAIAGTTLLVSSVFFVILAILCPHSSIAFAFYTALSATTTASGGALLASTLIDKEHSFGMYNKVSKDLI